MSQQLVPHKPLTLLEPQQINHIAVDDHPEQVTVTLYPLAMRIPNRYGVYSLNELQPRKKVSLKVFLSRYAPHPQEMRVCFDETNSPDELFKNSMVVTAYTFALEDWYLASLTDIE